MRKMHLEAVSKDGNKVHFSVPLSVVTKKGNKNILFKDVVTQFDELGYKVKIHN